MAIRPVDIVLRARNDGLASATDAAISKIRALGDTADKTGARLRDASGRFIKGANDSVKAATDLDTAIKKVGSTGGGVFESMRDKVTGFGAGIRRAKQDNDDFVTGLEKLRSSGVVLTGLGVGAMALSAHFREVSAEGEGIQARLEALLKQQGRLGDMPGLDSTINRITSAAHLPDDDPVREAAVQMASDAVPTKYLNDLLEATVRNAKTLHQPIDQVGIAFSKAFGEQSLTRLKRINILFSEQEENAVKAAFAVSEAAGQQAFMKAVIDSTNRSTGALGEGFTDAQNKANDMANAADSAMTALGSGAASAKGFQDELKTSMLAVLNTSPEFLQAAGFVGQFGGEVVTATGTVVTLGSQVAITIASLKTMGVTGSMALNALQMTGSLALVPILKIAAVAIVAAAAIYALDKALHWKEDQELAANIKAGEGKDTESLRRLNQMRAKHGLPPLSPTASDPPDGVAPDMSDLKAQLDAAQGGVSPVGIGASMGGGVAPTVATGAAMAPDSDTPASASYQNAIENLQSQLRHAGKGEKAAIQDQIAAMRSADRHAKERERDAKRRASQDERERKKAEREAKGEKRDRDEVDIAQLEADTEVKIAELKAQKVRGHAAANAAIDHEIAVLKANELIAKAKIHGDAKGEAIANIKSAALLDKDAVGGSTGPAGISLPDFFRGGGSVFDLPKKGGTGGGGDSGAGGDTRLTARIASQTVQPTSSGKRYIIDFERIVIDVADELARQASLLPFSPGVG